MKIIVCAAQMEIENLNVDVNLARADAFAREAAEEHGAHFLCYPELFITGALTGRSMSLAQTVPGPYTDHFCETARKYGLHIIMGSITEKDGDKFYNTSVLIDDSGNIIGKYRKLHLWCGEKIANTRGSEIGVFDTRWGKIGIEICWDIAFPELTKRMAMEGARLCFCPTLWTHDDRYSYLNCMQDSAVLKSRIPDVETEEIYIKTCTAARAIENNMAFIMVNGCGKTRIGKDIHTLVGNTRIALPFYGNWKFLANEERLLTAEIDLDLLDLAETAYRTLGDSWL